MARDPEAAEKIPGNEFHLREFGLPVDHQVELSSVFVGEKCRARFTAARLP